MSGPLLIRIPMVFDRATQSRGLAYARDRHVLDLVVHGRTAEARVRGSRPTPYLVTVACPISVRHRLRTSCSCPMGREQIPCKHVYAVLAQLDVQRVDLGAEGRLLDLVAQDPHEAQQSLGLSDDPAARSGRLPRDEAAGDGFDRNELEDDDFDDDFDDLDDSDGGDTAFDEDDFHGYRGRSQSRVAVPRRAIAPRSAGVADIGWRRRLDWIQRAPSPMRALRAPGEIEIVLTQVPWIDDRGEARALPIELTVAVHARPRRRDGTLGARTPVDVSGEGRVSPADRALIDLLLGCTPRFLRQSSGLYSSGPSWSPDVEPHQYLTGASIHPSAAARVLPVLCASGRLGSLEPPADPSSNRGEPGAPRALRWDGDAPFGARLRAASAGRAVALQLELARDGETIAAERVTGLPSASYAILEDRLIRIEGCDDLAHWFVAAGHAPLRLAVGELAALIEMIGSSPRAPQLVLDALGWTTVPGIPVPRLYLEPIPGAKALGGRVRFGYGANEALAAGGTLVVDPGAHQVIVRDLAAEAAARAQLTRSEGRWIAEASDAEHEVTIDLARFVEGATALQEMGWELWVRGGRLRRGGHLKVHVESDVDWFDVSLAAEFEGLDADLPELLQALRDGQPFARLPDGTVGMVLPEWLARRSRLATLGKLGDRALRIPRAAAPLLDAMLATMPDVAIDAAFRRLRARLARATAVRPGREPRSFRGALRPYQRDALGWFRFLDDVGLGGCLADDMGLGKTVQVLAMLSAPRRSRRPSLVVAPKTVVFNWLDEARRFSPRLRVVDYTGPDRSARRAAAAEADLVVTSYSILRLDAEELAGWELDYAILDEAQAIKNPEARVTQAARVLRARRRLALTGTPVENHLGDLASILEFLNPGLTDSSSALRALLATQPGSAADLAPLARALRPFLLRRTKDQVLPDLPARTEQVLRCPLGAEQRRQYDQLLAHYRAALLPQVAREGMARSTMHVLEALLRLRQAACHAGLIDPGRAKAPSAKLDALLAHAAEATESGHKALIFSQFTSFLALVRARLDAAGATYEYLDGETRDRKQRVARFQTDPACKLFLISLKAGGMGVNLTAADYVYLLDPWWNPAVEAQAIDRTHRPGQTRPVLAYRLIAENTVEDKILELQARKRQLAGGIFADDGGGLAKLTVADLELLFS